MLHERYILFVIFKVLFLQLRTVDSANWAQTSGHLQQTQTITVHPSPDKNHWRDRFGHAVVKFASGKRPDVGELYLLGGDTYDNREGPVDPGLLDSNYANGYKNDVWKSSGADWKVESDIRLRNTPRNWKKDQEGAFYKARQKIPLVKSTMTWSHVSEEQFPTPGVPYNEWIICLDSFREGAQYKASRKKRNCCDNLNSKAGKCNKDRRMWSPRRHHAAVSFGGYIYVLGGRARELIDFSEYRSVGGIKDPRFKDISNGLTVDGNETMDKAKFPFSTQREASVVKNDVWRSKDGKNWDLVAAGCRAPQDSLIPSGVIRDNNGEIDPNRPAVFGTRPCKIYTDSRGPDYDCYGNEKCSVQKLTCVCQMWSAREQHSVAGMH